ncbi:DUF5659 domain-containing protein [Bacillus sp. Hm123]|uniref:DUF5659 domain-containing protein n=1 Tax=Bacillus sp. Hm123 TaxID=3450745 RepID=UPI003F44516D
MKRIFNKDIAMYLIRNGHELIKCEPHRNNKTTIFIFEKTEQLTKDLNTCLSF